MLLPSFLYEILPLLYLIGGSIELVTGQNILLLIAALLFFCSGGAILILRSANRRTDRYNDIPPHKPSKWLVLPETLYEAKPFAYLLLGVMLLRADAQAITLIAGFLFISWSLICEYRRVHHRQHIIHKYSHKLF